MEAVDKVQRTISSCKHPWHLRVCQNWVENLEKSGKISKEESSYLAKKIDAIAADEAFANFLEETLQ